LLEKVFTLFIHFLADLPNGLPGKGEDLLLAAKLGAICQLSYRNSDLSDEFTESEKKWLDALKITDYKIWSENLTEGKVDANGFTTRNSDSQAITGVISLTNEDYVEPKPFVCFRGTKSFSDMLHDVASILTVPFKTKKGTGIGDTGLGFVAKLEAFHNLGLEEHVIELVNKYQNGLFITGHSLGGAVASLFTAALNHDYPELFQGKSARSMVQVTFGAPRVYDRATALKINSLPFKNLRFVNETDLIPTLPYWKLGSLYHTGDCYYVEDKKYMWHWIQCTAGIDDDQLKEEAEGDPDADADAPEGDDNGDNVDTATSGLMKLKDRDFNFASDGHVSEDKYENTFAKFTIGGGDTHSLSAFSGYLDQLVNSYVFREQLKNCTNAEVVETFKQLPVEISKPSELKEFGKALIDLFE
jgi:hypothetical protein